MPFSGYTQNPFRAPNGVIITPEAHIQAAEGQLLLFCNNMQTLSPYAFQPMASDTIKFATVSSGIQYQFTVSAPAEIQFSTQAEAILASRIDVSVANITQDTRTASVSCAWKVASATMDHQPGILLRQDSNPNMLSVPYELQWHDQHTWLFLRNAFVRGEEVLYWVNPNDQAWETTQQVRQASIPYETITPKTLLGIQQISCTIASGEKNSFTILLPYVPIDVAQYKLWQAASKPSQ